jgi:hypothetical protein
MGAQVDKQADRSDFYGILGRIVQTDDTVVLRFYPYAFSATPKARPVFVVTLERAEFQDADVRPLLEQEVDVTIFSNRAEVWGVFQDKAVILRAGSVAAEWAEYDNDDFIRRVNELEAEYERLNTALTKAVQKNRKGIALIRELLRRAEIKAGASEYLEARQAPAIAVLDRLLRHFESDD